LYLLIQDDTDFYTAVDLMSISKVCDIGCHGSIHSAIHMQKWVGKQPHIPIGDLVSGNSNLCVFKDYCSLCKLAIVILLV